VAAPDRAFCHCNATNSPDRLPVTKAFGWLRASVRASNMTGVPNCAIASAGSQLPLPQIRHEVALERPRRARISGAIV